MSLSNNLNSQKKNRKNSFWPSLISKMAGVIVKRKPDNHWQAQNNLDKKLVLSLSKSRIPNLTQLKYINKYLTKKELFIIRVCSLIILVSLGYASVKFYRNHLQTVPVRGGEYTEGMVGSPKHINPLYANLSDVDNDFTALIFSSLFKRDKGGALVKDLAENYTISQDNKIYEIAVKQNVKWHSGSNLTVDDIIFTFGAIKDSQYNSSLRSSFIGVEIEKIDDTKIKFILAEPYSAFLDLLTFGIMPSEYWLQIPPASAALADLNLKPVGSGPYKFNTYIKDKSGSIIEYKLDINEEYYNSPALIKLKFKFFPNFEEAVSALKTNTIDGISYLPKELEKEITVTSSYNFNKLHIPQMTLLFLNGKNNEALGVKQTRQALALAIDKSSIVNNVLGGDAYIVDGPILPESFAYYNEIKKYNYNTDEAAKILDNVGWKLTEIKAEDIRLSGEKEKSTDEKTAAEAREIIGLGEGQWRKKDNKYFIVKISTVDKSVNSQIAEAIKKNWEKIGVKTEIELYQNTQIQKDVIKPRNFEVLFYAQVVGADPDPYAFWHSSQTESGGSNIAGFANKEADQLLEDARLITDIKQRQEKYKRFQEIIAEESPVIFMYSPAYTYIQNKTIKKFEVTDIVYPSDRFANINEWYIETSKKIVW